MKNSANNQVSEREAQGSSVQTAHMKIEIPSDIQSPNHRRAYAMAYRAAYQRKHLHFVSDIVRFSIERGWQDGERAYWKDVERETQEMLAEEAYYSHHAHA